MSVGTIDALQLARFLWTSSTLSAADEPAPDARPGPARRARAVAAAGPFLRGALEAARAARGGRARACAHSARGARAGPRPADRRGRRGGRLDPRAGVRRRGGAHARRDRADARVAR